MSLKKILLSLSIIIMMLAITLIPNLVLAANELYLGITELNSNNWGYAIGDPNSNITTGNAHKIWNILEYVSAEDNSALKVNGNENIYCVNAGVGFSDINKRATYNVFYDMKTEKEKIKAQNDVLKALVEGNIPGNDSNTTVSKYNALLALSDMLYLNGDTEQQKMALLESAGIVYDEYEQGYVYLPNAGEPWEALITDDDIKAVQQAAIWYFTNYYEVESTTSQSYIETTTHSMKYDKTNSTGWLNYTLDGTNYDNLSDYNKDTGEGSDRNQQAEILYNYLIKTAKANANNYSPSSSVGTTSLIPAQVTTQTLQYEELGANYVVGPIKITESAGNIIPYTINLGVKVNGVETKNYKLITDKNDNTTETTIEDSVGKDVYVIVSKADITSIKVSIKISYNNTKLTLWTSATNGNGTQPVMIPERTTPSVDWEKTVTPDSKIFDLALRKYITKIKKVDGNEVSYSRTPVIEEGTISSATTTATYKHKKDPVLVETGDIVTYKLTIYNEGEKDGRATKVVDQLPTGLKFSKVVSGNFKLDSYSENDNTLNLVRKENNSENLSAYTQGSLDSETIEIECEVIATPDEKNIKILTNVAWISEEIDADGNVITNQDGLDIDSEPSAKPDVNKDNMENYTGNADNKKEDLDDKRYYYKGQQDDDDFEKLKLMPESFDLKLIKRITAVNNQNVQERIEKVDVSKLNTIGEDGKLVTTADYKLNKTPVSVKQGDIVTYTFRIYNEGTIDGYATEITEDIPDGLEYLWDDGIEYTEGHINWDNVTKEFTDEEKEAIEFNFNNGWSYAGDSSLKTIKTDYLARHNETIPGDGSNLIKAFGSNDSKKTEADISFKEVSVKLKVVSEDVTGTIIRNEACISEDTNKNGDPVDDRDSNTENWKKYEDDEDYDNIILKAFDLALRKFIIAVSDDTEIENEEYLKDENGFYTRAPSVDISKLNTIGEDGKLITTAIYNHTKEPVMVQKNDIVVYMLRVYNEGEIDGYAAEIKDHLPPHLEFVDGEFNKKYGWEVSEDGRTVKTDYLKDEKIKAAEWIPQKTGMTDKSDLYKLTYKEVPIMCKVKDTAKSDENITNIADITEYLDENKESVNDRDSQEDNVVLPEDDKLPSYKDDETGEYIPGQQDDDDFEKLIVKEFDLALRKWVTQAIVIDKNGQTITETGHKPYDDPEKVVKVELHKKKLNQVTVKFKYSIRVINEGDIAGYAKEVTDYIPQGLKFVAEDNKGWTDEGNNVISTRLLENTLLQPGEYADVEVVLTWINSQDNMGEMINTAEISEDDNDYDVQDRDSTPDNQKPGEDDIDVAPVMLSISTGQVRIYFTLGFVVLITIAGGIVLIKKYVL